MTKIKERILNLLLDTERNGIENMVEFLGHGSDFFTAPASTRYHLAHPGGLAEHSLSVYDTLLKLDAMLDTMIPLDQIAITALLHDVCKTDYYIEVKKWRKDEHGKWESYIAWGVDDKLPLGHGEKSMFIISKYIQLSDEEAAAIRWHMLAFDPGIHFNYPSGYAFRAAADKYPLVTLLFTADYLSSQLVEGSA